MGKITGDAQKKRNCLKEEMHRLKKINMESLERLDIWWNFKQLHDWYKAFVSGSPRTTCTIIPCLHK